MIFTVTILFKACGLYTRESGGREGKGERGERDKGERGDIERERGEIERERGDRRVRKMV